MTRVLIRAATGADVGAVLPMVRAICDMHEGLDPARYDMLPDVVERYSVWLPQRAEDPESVFLVADATEEGGELRLAGFCVGTVEQNIPIYRTDRFGFVHDLWVEPAFRRHGVGRGLAEGALEMFARIGVRQVRLETAAGNEGARAVFASCGFRVATVDMIAVFRDAGAGGRRDMNG